MNKKMRITLKLYKKKQIQNTKLKSKYSTRRRKIKEKKNNNSEGGGTSASKVVPTNENISSSQSGSNTEPLNINDRSKLQKRIENLDILITEGKNIEQKYKNTYIREYIKTYLFTISEEEGNEIVDKIKREKNNIRFTQKLTGDYTNNISIIDMNSKDKHRVLAIIRTEKIMETELYDATDNILDELEKISDTYKENEFSTENESN